MQGNLNTMKLAVSLFLFAQFISIEVDQGDPTKGWYRETLLGHYVCLYCREPLLFIIIMIGGKPGG